jgi:hypothetical protein
MDVWVPLVCFFGLIGFLVAIVTIWEVLFPPVFQERGDPEDVELGGGLGDQIPPSLKPEPRMSDPSMDRRPPNQILPSRRNSGGYG